MSTVRRLGVVVRVLPARKHGLLVAEVRPRVLRIANVRPHVLRVPDVRPWSCVLLAYGRVARDPLSFRRLRRCHTHVPDITLTALVHPVEQR